MLLQVGWSLFAGLLATLAMLLVTHLLDGSGAEVVHLAEVLGAKVWRGNTGPVVSYGLHVLLGTALGGIYGTVLYPLLPGPVPLRGLLFGVGLWLLLMVVVLPLAQEGLFARRRGGHTALMTLIGHVVYGGFLGVIFRL